MKYLFVYSYGAVNQNGNACSGDGSICMNATGTDKITKEVIYGELGAINVARAALEKDGMTNVKVVPMGWFKFEDYKDGYCENLELKPCYPQKGCDDFSKRNELEKNEYKRGWHDAIDMALKETRSVHTEEGSFRVVQEETLIGVGMAYEQVSTEKTGRWHRKYDSIVNDYFWECDNCKCGFQRDYPYCPNCGAKMEVEE